MIIVEGYDGSGKTTLATNLSKALKLDVMHAGGPPNTCEEVQSCLARSQSRMLVPVIQDRVTHISESVYAMLTKPRHSAMALSRVGDLACARVLVYCRPSTETILRNVADHKMKGDDTEDHITHVKLNAVPLIHVYDTVIALAGRHVCMVDWDFEKDDWNTTIALIRRLIR